MHIYVSGPMGGKKNHNYPLFFEVSRKLIEFGHDVSNPASKLGADWRSALIGSQEEQTTYEENLNEDIFMMLDCDTIVLLPGWHDSRGACVEIVVAYTVGLDFLLWQAGAFNEEWTAPIDKEATYAIALEKLAKLHVKGVQPA